MAEFRVIVAQPAQARERFRLSTALDALDGRVRVELNPHADRPFSPAELAERLAGAQALITGWGSGPVTAEAYASAGGLRVVALVGSSLRKISPEAAWRRGAVITNTAGAIGQSVAEYTLGLILSMLHGYNRFDAALKGGAGWPDAQAAAIQRDLADQRVGLVGLGAVGTKLASHLTCMGAQVAVFDPFVTDQRVAELGLTRCASADDLFATCGIVSLHAGLIEQTRHMVGAAQLAAMKPGSILVNTGRGGLVDEPALVASLRAGHVSAALDVFEDEPLPANHPLRSMGNVVLSPHIAGYCNRSTYARCAAAVVADVLRVADDRPVENLVTQEMYRRAT